MLCHSNESINKSNTSCTLFETARDIETAVHGEHSVALQDSGSARLTQTVRGRDLWCFSLLDDGLAPKLRIYFSNQMLGYTGRAKDVHRCSLRRLDMRCTRMRLQADAGHFVANVPLLMAQIVLVAKRR